MDALLAAYRINMMQDLYAARKEHWQAQEEYWRSRGLTGKGATEQGIAEAERQGRAAYQPGGGGGGDGQANASDFEKVKSALIPEEGSGSYTQLGPVVPGRGQAVGKYQVMPENVGPWTKQYLGREMTPEEFRNDPAAQDKLFEGRMMDRFNHFGNWRDVISEWHSGLPYNDAIRQGRHDQNETTKNYTDNVVARAGITGAGDRAQPPDVAGTTTTAPTTVAQDRGPNNIYANVPIKDSRGEDQIPKFMRWNSDPVGNEKAKLAEIDPQMQKVIARARADNPGLNFVLGNGKRSAAEQDLAKKWGWSPVGSKDGGDANVHMKGNAADLWPLDSNGRITFDPAQQKRITDAIKKAAQEEGVKINAGGDFKNKDMPHFELKGSGTSASLNAPEGPPALHSAQADTSRGGYQVAGDVPIGLTAEQAEKSRRDLEAHRASGVEQDQRQVQTLPTPPGGSAADQTVTADQLKPPLEADFAPTPAYARYPDSTMYPQAGPGTPQTTRGPGSDASAPVGPAIPPIALGGGRGNELEPPSGTPAIPIALGGGRGNELEPPSGEPAPGYKYSTGASGGDPRAQDATVNRMTGMAPGATNSGYVPPNITPGRATPNTPVANAPSADAQPVSAVTPQGNQAIPNNPRFVQIYQPNIARTGNARGGQGGDNNAPLMGVPNLSWGPNLPLDQRTAQSSGPTPYGPNSPRLNPSGNIVLNQPGQPERSVPVPMPPSRPSDDSVGTPDMASLPDNSFDVTASRKGGPIAPAIPRYATGGQVTRFAAGGATLGTPATMAQLASPAYVGPTVSGGWVGTPESQLAPNQQAWAAQQQAEIAKIPGTTDPSGLNFTMMPDAVWPTAAAPAAPTTVNQSPPTVKAVSTPNLIAADTSATGAYKLPNIVAPTNDPAMNQNNTTVNPTPKIPSTLVPNAFGGVNDVGNTNFNKQSNSGGNNINTGAYAGFNKGGIPRRPMVTRFAAAGAVTAQQEEDALHQAIGYGPTSTVQSLQASYNAMTPEQQQWYTAQNAALQGYEIAGQAAGASYTPNTAGGFGSSQMDINRGQLALANNQKAQFQSQFNLTEPTTPAPATPAAAAPAAAAPAPAIPPTVKAISTPNLIAADAAATGAYKLPNTVGPTNTVNTPSTTVNPTPKIPSTLVSNTPNTGASDIGGTDFQNKINTGSGGSKAADDLNTGSYAGFRRGGITRRVTGYDDGGGVSPSFVGMPPGLGGGQQAIPPIYYNSATFAPAGAGVGKGVTVNSAPTYVAGAIPTLPMYRGGVVGYDDGGDVQPDPTAGMDQVALNDYDPRDEAINRQIDQDNAPAPASQPGGALSYFTPTEDQAQPPAQPAQAQPQDDPHRPANLPPYTAQIKDDYGNPSNGLISAITGGIHWLADHLGVVGGAQAAPAVAPDAQTQQNRQVYASRANMITKADREEINNMADPHHSLDDFMRNIAGMEQAYRWLLGRGDITNANKMAASILQYDVANANDYQEEAAKRYYDGDLPGAVKAINAAADAVPAGTRYHAELAQDGKSLVITGSDLNGRELWKQAAAPQAILGAVNKSMPWTMLESQAAKYDGTFKEMANARKASQEGQAEGNVLKQMYAPPAPAMAAPAPATPQPAMPTAPQPAPTITADTTTTPAPVSTAGAAEGRAPPATSDSNLSSGVAPGGDTGTAMAALPSQPTRGSIGDGNAPNEANVPTLDAQNVELDRQEQSGRTQIRAEIVPRYIDQKTGAYVNQGPQVPAYPPSIPGFENLQPARQNQIMKDYGVLANNRKAWELEQNKLMNGEISAAEGQLHDQIQAKRDAAGREFTEGQANIRAQRGIEAATTADTRKYQHEDYTNEQKDALDKSNKVFSANLAGAAPRSDTEMNSLAGGEGKPYDPYLEVAKAFNPDLGNNPNLNRATAMNDMVQKGFDANTQRVLAGAYDSALRHSRNSTPDEISAGIQSFVTNNAFTANAEAKDEKGNPVALHGAVRFDVTVEDNTGNHISFRIPAGDLANLRNLRYQYSQQQQTNLAKTVGRGGLLGAIGAGPGRYAPTSQEDWQGRNAQQQTQEPPF